MLISEVAKLSPVDRLLYWMKERNVVRKAKEAGLSRPWTDDTILQGYRFCNVRRMDDKVSQWLLKNWYDPHFDHPNMLAACCIARHFNKPEVLGCITGHVLGKKYRPDIALAIIQEIKGDGHTVFSAAYMIHADQSADKSEMVINRVVQPMVDSPPPIDPTSIERSVSALTPCWNIGSFMAGQIVADLRWAKKGTWEDAKTWAAIGPGSKRGMNRLQGREIACNLPQNQFLLELRELIKTCYRKLGSHFCDRLEAIDYQNSLCELDKYSRVLLGEGRPKQKYNGTA